MTNPHQPIPGFDNTNNTLPPQPQPQTEQVPAWAQALINQNQAMAAELENMKKSTADQAAVQAATQMQQQAQAMGYVPGTPAFALLLQQADTDFTNGDLNKAHEIVKAMGLAPVEQPAEGAPPAQPQSPHDVAMAAALGQAAPAPVVPPAPAAAPAFPLTAAAAGAPPAGAPVSDAPSIADVGKHDKNDAALKYIQAFQSAESGNFPT